VPGPAEGGRIGEACLRRWEAPKPTVSVCGGARIEDAVLSCAELCCAARREIPCSSTAVFLKVCV